MNDKFESEILMEEGGMGSVLAVCTLLNSVAMRTLNHSLALVVLMTAGPREGSISLIPVFAPGLKEPARLALMVALAELSDKIVESAYDSAEAKEIGATIQ